MKVLFIHDKYSKEGGAEKFILLERKNLEKDGHQTFLFTLTEEKDLDINNSKIIPFKKKWTLGSYWLALKVFIELKKYIKEINPSLILINNNYEFPFSFLSSCRGYETIQWVHDYGIICPSRWCVYKDNLKICNGKIGIKCLKHKCISLPLFLSYYLKLKYIKKNKVVKTYFVPSIVLKNYMEANGFKNVKFKEYPFITTNRYRVKRKENSFLYIGGLYKHKGVYLLIDAFKEILKLNPNLKLKIIGTGPEEDTLKNISKKEIKNKNIIFLGKIENKKTEKYYKEATAIIVPSIWMENLSYVTREAISYNTEVIGSDAGGIKELIERYKGGTLFRRNDKEDLIKKILEFSNKR